MNNNFTMDKMNEGEIKLFNFLMQYDNNEFKVIPNVILNKKDTGTNQIDMIIINKKGIFVLEYKGIIGKVLGYENSKEWTVYYKKYYFPGGDHKILNPIKQNESHIKTIRNILNIENIFCPIYNLVVFDDDANISNVSSNEIIKMNQIKETIEKYSDSDYDFYKVFEIIMNYNIKDVTEREKHLEYINSIINPSQDNSHIAYQYNRLQNNRYSKPANFNFFRHVYLRISRRIKRALINFALFMIFIIIALVLGSFTRSKETSLTPQNNAEQNEVEQNNVSKQKYIEGMPLIGLGNKKSQVINSMGQPDEIDKYSQNTWRYNSAYIYFDSSTNTVIGWQDDNYRTLRMAMKQANSNYNKLMVGSTQEDVLNALGAPIKIGQYSKNTWEYQGAGIYFDSYSKKVVGWIDNDSKLLRNVMQQPIVGANNISVGSTQQDVLNVLGAPKKIGQYSKNTWEYEDRAVYFDYNLKVKEIKIY